MLAYILRRFGSIFVIMFLASIIIFAITQFLPGDVAQLVLGQFATEEAIANLREEYGLNRPFYVQYLDWALNFIKGDWGDSLVNRMPIFPMVMSRLRNSAMLALVVLMIYVPLGIFLGVLAALKRDKLPDQMITTVSMVFVALPVFVSSLLLIPLFSHYLGWLPANSSIHPDSSFGEALPFLILPAIAVALNSIGYVARMTRAGTIDVLRTDYVRAAYLKGLPRRQVLFRHVLRNALLPTVTIVAMDAGMMIGGMLVAEVVFGYPGLGRLLLYAMQNQDLPLIQACSMVAVTMLCLANLVADLLYGFLNPRIRVK
ncbi:MAG: ABC transporter permease [Thermacetogeniaceae bacterium]|jgi:peptide/nickel transport system permease protein|nr:ABC transporter permease [Syntrophomonadaceae bacterium]